MIGMEIMAHGAAGIFVPEQRLVRTRPVDVGALQGTRGVLFFRQPVAVVEETKVTADRADGSPQTPHWIVGGWDAGPAGDRYQPVLGIVLVGVNPVGTEIAVGVIAESHAGGVGILVEPVGGAALRPLHLLGI